MQYIFFALGILGIIIFLLGLKWTVRGIKHKEITKFPLTEKPNEVTFQKPGLYSLNFVGGLKAQNRKDFNATISKNEKQVEVYELRVNYKFFYQGNVAIEFYKFEIPEFGKYIIQFKNISGLEMKSSALLITGAFQNKLTFNNITVLVKETQSSIKKLLAIIFTILGLQCALVGFIFAFNPHLYN